MDGLKPSISNLPFPLNKDIYRCLRIGISDDPEVSVWINVDEDFVFLHPTPLIDYDNYRSRVQSLGLQTYKNTSDMLEQRLAKISSILATAHSLVEIGAADAAFLALVHERFPKLDCYAVEPDQDTRPARDALPWLRQSTSLPEIVATGVKTDLIAMFHVFEHLEQPAEILSSVHQALTPGGHLLIEVPSLTDPLLSLYASSPYEKFYFQRQHPYVYSASSLERVLAANGFAVELLIPHQRYGIENHLQWLTAAKPGGNKRFHDLFADLGNSYRICLEQAGVTDAVIVLAKAII